MEESFLTFHLQETISTKNLLVYTAYVKVKVILRVESIVDEIVVQNANAVLVLIANIHFKGRGNRRI